MSDTPFPAEVWWTFDETLMPAPYGCRAWAQSVEPIESHPLSGACARAMSAPPHANIAALLFGDDE